MKKGILSLFLFLITQLCWAQFNLPSGKPVKVFCDNAEEKVVHTALYYPVIVKQYFPHRCW